jgi:hypothetical protein
MTASDSPDDQVPLFTDGGVTWTVSRRTAETGRALAELSAAVAAMLADARTVRPSDDRA